MKAYVLNLARRPDRLKRFFGWNANHALEFEVVPAVDGSTIDRDALVAEGVLGADHSAFTNGAIGNALSHRAQWQACIAEGRPRLVLEDDACLHRTFAAQVSTLMTAMDQCDLMVFGYNTDAQMMMILPDNMLSVVFLSTPRLVDPNYFMNYATAAPPRPLAALHSVATFWGTLAYAVSPQGAERLLASCFPLSTACEVRMYAEHRNVVPCALDGMINVALQSAQVSAAGCYPPLALSPNDLSDVSPPSSAP